MPSSDQTITYHFPSVLSLKKAYMDFVREGGIFVPTEAAFHLGDLVTVVLTLPEDEQTYTFTSDVIWITPKHTSGNGDHAGIGLQCSESQGDAFQKSVIALISEIEVTAESDTM